MESKSPEKHRSAPLLGNNEPNPEKKSMTMPAHTHKKSDNLPIPANTKKHKGEGCTTAHKTYSTFLHKISDY